MRRPDFRLPQSVPQPKKSRRVGYLADEEAVTSMTEFTSQPPPSVRRGSFGTHTSIPRLQMMISFSVVGDSALRARGPFTSAKRRPKAHGLTTLVGSQLPWVAALLCDGSPLKTLGAYLVAMRGRDSDVTRCYRVEHACLRVRVELHFRAPARVRASTRGYRYLARRTTLFKAKEAPLALDTNSCVSRRAHRPADSSTAVAPAWPLSAASHVALAGGAHP
jgi:hypothetical protein